MQMQIGGVGFYPTSGSPFVHMDVGNVRAWPRMSRQELARIFPDGKTLHLPSDGRPLPGYDQALAQVRRKPGNGVSSPTADNDSDPELTGSGSSLLTAMLPVPRTKAQAMIDTQIGRSDGLDDELGLQAVPVPTHRPVQVKFVTDDAPTPIGLSAQVGNFVQHVPHVFFTEAVISIASLPMHGAAAPSGQRFKGHKAFGAQSLRPLEHATGSNLASFEPRSHKDAVFELGAASETGSGARSEQFDTGRFWAEG